MTFDNRFAINGLAHRKQGHPQRKKEYEILFHCHIKKIKSEEVKVKSVRPYKVKVFIRIRIKGLSP